MILDDFAPLDLDPVAMQEEVCPLCSETESKSMDVCVTCHDFCTEELSLCPITNLQSLNAFIIFINCNNNLSLTLQKCFRCLALTTP